MDLHDAVEANNLERVRLLVEQGADKDKGNSIGCTPLWLASWKGSLELAQYLVEQGSDLGQGRQLWRYSSHLGCSPWSS